MVAQTGYDPERDLSHPADSVFCAHGAGFIVPWNEVPDHMHVEGRLLKKKEQQEEAPSGKKTKTYDPDHWIDIEEIDAILARTYHANKHEKGATKQWRTAKKVISGDNAPRYAPVKAVSKEEYLLVDGYNIIFAWESLKELAAVNIDGARGKLLDILCNYQGIKKCNLIVVFDAYRVKGHQTEMLDHHNIHVVYTKEAETADAYIEKFAHENGRKYHVTVATSDGLEQIINTGMLRCMSKAVYEEKPKGHYGLVLKDYAHFTSPIRRYPDLAIHRIMTDLLRGTDKETMILRYSDFAEKASKQSSEREVIAMQIERKAEDCYKAEYARRHLGECYEGTISGVTQRGLFVELENGVEGFVPASSLTPSGTNLTEGIRLSDPVSGKSWSLGDSMMITIVRADVNLGKVDFEVAPEKK